MSKISLKENTTEILALFPIVAAFIFLTALLFKPIPSENRDLVITLSSLIIGTAVGGVYGYYFGQSKKRETIAESGTAIINSTETKEIK